MQLSLFEQPTPGPFLCDLFTAYFEARKNKRNTLNALAFEKRFEENLFNLASDITNGRYTPGRSICFIVNRPVKREIFAAEFRDRVVHHLLYNYISPFFEKSFINDCYSCRKGKGTHYGIERMDHFIRSCSRNYSRDCYVLKLDIRGYFMSINRTLLFEKVVQALKQNRHGVAFDLDIVLYLLRKVIFNDPTRKCLVKGTASDWDGLPADKSLFHARPGCGLPIGNLTSQLFGNVYLDDFDHFVKRELGFRYYGRYVDDFVLVHCDRQHLIRTIPYVRDYLKDNLMLELHPKKIWLQHYSRGLSYLGAVVKPHRIYVANRTRGNFHDAINRQNLIARDHKPTREEKLDFRSSMNSYLGIMKHYRTFRLRRRIVRRELSGWWCNYVKTDKSIMKFSHCCPV